MNYDKYDTICCKRCIHLLIYSELPCIDHFYHYNPEAIKIECIGYIYSVTFVCSTFLQCDSRPISLCV